VKNPSHIQNGLLRFNGSLLACTIVVLPLSRFKPLVEKEGGVLHSALLLRRYTKNWEKPDDRKVNPWDINEPDPTDTGTMGTVPGPVIECNVGDDLVVEPHHIFEMALQTTELFFVHDDPPATCVAL